MHSGGKGISKSSLPYKRSPPSWLKISAQEVTEHVCKLAKKGLTPSQVKREAVHLHTLYSGGGGFWEHELQCRLAFGKNAITEILPVRYTTTAVKGDVLTLFFSCVFCSDRKA